MQATDDLALVYTVCASEEEALQISRAVVRERLAACTNYWPIQSVYVWQGELTEDTEVALIVKTTRARVPEVFDRIRAMHSYELPCLLELAPREAGPEYADWIRRGSAGS
ncbi:MAG: divalent-cation tolerance protein CutA [Chloroflexota bacterium]|nr:divalent-cation tolerance protein CutA [Chloroflexota bacterium]